MSLDLTKLANKLDEALSNETTESLTKFLNDKRMTNNKQQTAVEWYIDELEKYEKGTSKYFSIPAIQNHARRMEKQQTRDDIKNELKLIGNYFDVGKLDQREQGHHIRFTSILKDRFDFYNETNGGNK